MAAAYTSVPAASAEERMWSRDAGDGKGSGRTLLRPQEPLPQRKPQAPASACFKAVVALQLLLALAVTGLGGFCIEAGRVPESGGASLDRWAYTSCSLGIEAAAGILALAVAILGLLLVSGSRVKVAYVVGCGVGCVGLVGGGLSAVVWLSLWSSAFEPPAFVLSFPHYFRTQATVRRLQDTHPDLVSRNSWVLGALLGAMLGLGLALVLGMCCGTQLDGEEAAAAVRRRPSHLRRRSSTNRNRI